MAGHDSRFTAAVIGSSDLIPYFTAHSSLVVTVKNSSDQKLCLRYVSVLILTIFLYLRNGMLLYRGECDGTVTTRHYCDRGHGDIGSNVPVT